MKLEHFLEKHDIRQVNIFRKLVLSGGSSSYAEMLDYLGVAKASLDKDLEAISFQIQDVKEDVRVDYDGQTISLFMSNGYSLDRIYQLYLQQAVKVSIILYLFKHQEFSITKLTQKLLISESSLFRKIKELNSYLAEFGIKIRNGQLQGEELQIRYFYYQFYWYVANKEAISNHKTDRQVPQMVQAMENFLGVTFAPENKQRLSIWFYISKKRIAIDKKKYQNLRQKMEPYLTDHLYQKIRPMVLRYFSRYSVEVDEEEAMLHFVFLLAFPILTEHDFHEYALLRDRHAPIASLDTYIAETIIIHYKFRKLPYMLERDIYYHLSHTHTKMYFFTGDIEIYEYEAMLQKEKQFTGKSLVAFADQLRTISISKLGLDEAENSNLLKMKTLKYISLLAIISFKMTTILQIGIDLKMDRIYTETLDQLLILNMQHINGTHVEKYQPNKNYNLVLTNVPPLKKDQYGQTQVYVLSEILSPFDMKNIQRIIQGLYESVEQGV